MTAPSTPPAGWYADPSAPSQQRWWDGERWTEHARQAPVAVPGPDAASTAPAVRRRIHPVAWVAGGAAAAIAIGSIGPWASAFGGIVSRSGTDGGSDGTITLVLGVAAGLALIASQTKPSAGYALLAAVLGLVCAVIGVADINDVSGRGSGVEVAWGLVLMTLGSVAVVLSAGWLAFKPSAWS
jgi:hypothetical protein